MDPRDEDAMASHIVRLLRDKKLADDLGTKGREHIRQHFLITRMIEQELTLFTALASGANKAPGPRHALEPGLSAS